MYANIQLKVHRFYTAVYLDRNLYILVVVDKLHVFYSMNQMERNVSLNEKIHKYNILNI